MVMMDKAGNSMLWRKLHDPASVLTPRQEKSWPPAQQSQFPSKYGQLPGIGDSPRPSQDNQIVPLKSGRKSTPLGMGQRSNTDQYDTEERIRQLEMRLGVSEKSNRALLEEVLRLQNDLRIATKKSEDVIRDEREARVQLSEAIRISNELITQLSERIKDTEEKIQDEKASLNSLFSHTKNVEKTVLSSQQDIQSRRDAQSIRLQELRVDLNETKQSRSQLEQVTYALSEELRALRNKVEGQQAEFVNMVTDVRNRARKLEEENRIHLETMRKQSDMHSMSDVNTTHLRGQVETRLTELRDVLMDVRGKQETEQNERRSLEKAMQGKINELYSSLSEQTRKREEGLHTVDMVLREKDHAMQAERLQMTSKVTDTVEDINKRLLAKEMKIREEIQQKFLQLEKLVQREQHSRQEFEKAAREDGDRKWQTLKKVLEEELNILKEKLEIERGRSRETINKLDQSITIVERQLAENKKQVDKVMAAEIKSRKIHEAGTSEKLGSVNEKLQIATSTLQQAIGGISQSMASNNEKMRREVKTMMGEQQQAGTRALSDMDARMMAVKQRMTALEDALDAKVASAAESLSARVTDRVEEITKWQDATGDTLRELGRSVQTIPQDIYQLEEKYKLLKSEMDSRVSHESDNRAREIEALRQELAMLRSRLDRQPKPASLQDLEAMNVNVRKLADNLQTVKTVLGMKIQSEQKLRGDEIQSLQGQIDDIKKAIEPMVGRSNPQFVKDGERGNQDEPDVNQWGVYNAYKWLMWKAHLTYKLWEIRARKNKKTPRTTESFHPKPGGVFSPIPRKQKPLSPGNHPSNPDGGFPQVSTKVRTSSQDSSRLKADWDASPVSEQQNLTNQVSSRSQPHSSYSPTPRQDIQNPEIVRHEPGQTVSESPLPENQSPVPENQKLSKSLQGNPAQPLSPFKFSDSEIENEERNPRLRIQNENVSPEPVIETKVVTITSGENTENVSFNKIN